MKVKGKQPWMKFFVGDWRTDPAVSLCTPAARGVWIDLLTAMHQAGCSGELRGTCDQLARIARCSTADLTQALTEFQTTGAADVTERNGVITVANRRMVREAQERERNRLRQAKFRESHCSGDSDNDDVTDKYPSDSELEPPSGNLFSGELPSILNTPEFRASLGAWITYKAERRDTYKPAGLTAMVSRAAKLATEHGVQAVIDAMERAAANRWAGWDQPGSFGQGKSNAKPAAHVGPGQRYRG
jgi:hypothetical protein